LTPRSEQFEVKAVFYSFIKGSSLASFADRNNGNIHRQMLWVAKSELGGLAVAEFGGLRPDRDLGASK
jgi:hypothetical protein